MKALLEELDEPSVRKEIADTNSTDESECAVITKKTPSSCISCMFALSYQYRLHCAALELYVAYKYLVSVSVTQVECERSLSFFKICKEPTLK